MYYQKVAGAQYRQYSPRLGLLRPELHTEELRNIPAIRTREPNGTKAGGAECHVCLVQCPNKQVVVFKVKDREIGRAAYAGTYELKQGELPAGEKDVVSWYLQKATPRRGEIGASASLAW